MTRSLDLFVRLCENKNEYIYHVTPPSISSCHPYIIILTSRSWLLYYLVILTITSPLYLYIQPSSPNLLDQSRIRDKMHWKKLLPLLTTLTGSTTSTPCAAPKATPQVCNGQAAYCNRPYSNITQIGSHDSAFVGPLPQQNQNIAVSKQLDFGIRFLQAQTHKNPLNDKVIELCHTSCFLEDAGSLEGYLRTVKTWLDGHANEVVTLLLTNQDSFSPESFGSVFKKVGLDSYAFVPQSSPKTLPVNQWPTMGELIASGKRLVVFLGISIPSL